MAQRPVANALISELEPVVLLELRRHLDSEDLWYAHDYVPYEQGENFAFLGGNDWDPSQVTLPKHITDALEILLITKDNLAGYHRELVEHFILEDKWGRWIGRWTAEEHLHAVALRNYLVVTREIDPAANEDVRVEHVVQGYRANTYSQLETLAFMAFFERAHAVFCRNLQAQIAEPALEGPRGRARRRGCRYRRLPRQGGQCRRGGHLRSRAAEPGYLRSHHRVGVGRRAATEAVHQPVTRTPPWHGAPARRESRTRSSVVFDG
jgi:acyl-[acyl-carrier-protein] desaturase